MPLVNSRASLLRFAAEIEYHFPPTGFPHPGFRFYLGMLLDWLDARDATRMGAALADDFATQSASASHAAPQDPRRADAQLQRLLQKFMQRVDREARSLRLNLFKRAKLANSFKWRLLEKGVEPQVADELTQALVVRLTADRSESRRPAESDGAVNRRGVGSPQTLLAKANELLGASAYAEAVACYRELLELDPRSMVACNNLGAALCGLGRYHEAAEQFRRAIGIKRAYADAHCNLGTVLRAQGRVVESEAPLRHALQLKPTYMDAQLSLSATLVLLSRWREAKALLESVLRRAPRNVTALVGLAQIAGPEGRFAEAESLLKRAIEIDPQAQAAWAGLVWLRKMTSADRAWLERAEQIAGGGLAPLEEANIRYAIGKFCDDVGDFKRAFRSYRRANELQKMAAEPYDREARTRFVDDMQRTYTGAMLSAPCPGASDSECPIFVVGMPRSGTSLVEQIIASHPALKGAGEFGFWSDAMRRHEGAIRREFLDEPLRRTLAAGYLRALRARCPDARRVVDKTPFNSDYLGIIHAVFPNARMLYVRRSPIDTCLSCYFQHFSADLDFTMDLADLAHYYREHERLIAHWRDALPAGTLLDVSYEELTSDQESATRRILDFLGLEWDERCLDFHKTERAVMTASFWQVRQEIYRRSGGRWRNYKEFIGPLLSLSDTNS
jgi:tetratricopeptide (TPR) repeat protein